MRERNDHIARNIIQLAPRMARLQRLILKQAPAPHLSLPQFRILGAVGAGASKASDLSDFQGVSKPAMSRHLDALVGQGLLKRGRSRSDRRQLSLEVTEKGLRKFHLLHQILLKELARRVGGLKASDQAVLESALPLLEAIVR
jgi:DNA-binding MarR family transcriptional regulator